MNRPRLTCWLATLLVGAACSSGGTTQTPDPRPNDAALSDAALSDAATSDLTRPPGPNLFKNPSFETWTGASSPNMTPDDWTNCSLGSGLGFDAVPDSCTGMPNMAADGTRYARAFINEGVQQTIATTVGLTYVITFNYSAVSGCFGGSSNSSWDVLVGGNSILSVPGDTSVSWRTAMTTFVATTNMTTICIRKTIGGQAAIDLLDVHSQ